MSRIFDALQRSGFEQTGVEHPDLISIASEVLDAPATPAPAVNSAAEPQAVALAEVIPMAEAAVQELEHSVSPASRSLDVQVPPSSRLVYFTEPHSLAAEKFRFLGVRLRQLRQNRTLKKVLVTSTMPEEGKSLISANLAGVLARRKERVLLIEGDMRRPNL